MHIRSGLLYGGPVKALSVLGVVAWGLLLIGGAGFVLKQAESTWLSRMQQQGLLEHRLADVTHVLEDLRNIRQQSLSASDSASLDQHILAYWRDEYVHQSRYEQLTQVVPADAEFKPLLADYRTHSVALRSEVTALFNSLQAMLQHRKGLASQVRSFDRERQALMRMFSELVSEVTRQVRLQEDEADHILAVQQTDAVALRRLLGAYFGDQGLRREAALNGMRWAHLLNLSGQLLLRVQSLSVLHTLQHEFEQDYRALREEFAILRATSHHPEDRWVTFIQRYERWAALMQVSGAVWQQRQKVLSLQAQVEQWATKVGQRSQVLVNYTGQMSEQLLQQGHQQQQHLEDQFVQAERGLWLGALLMVLMGGGVVGVCAWLRRTASVATVPFGQKSIVLSVSEVCDESEQSGMAVWRRRARRDAHNIAVLADKPCREGRG